MSSILNALKRLEAEAQPTPGRPLSEWLNQPEARPGRRARILGFFHGISRLWWVAAIVLAAAAAFVWIAERPPASVKTEAESVASSPVVPEPGRISETRPVQPPASAAAPVAAAAPPKPAVAGALPPIMPWAQPATPSTLPSPPSAADPRPASSFSLAPLPAAAGLTLQAISWAPRAERRIAVVSGRILHVGDDIDGYRVQAIDPDGVTVCSGGECFGLIFDVSR